MRLVVRKEPLRWALKWGQSALIVCGAALLGYCGFVLVDAWNFQRRESADLDRQIRDRAPQLASATLNSAPAAKVDGLIGRLSIPRIALSAIVVEGIGRTSLRRAVGHIPGTALPGQTGNVGLSGHRDTFFRALKDLKVKDEIRFSTLNGDFKYEVESIRVVEPNNVAVLAPSHDNVLTLVTCYPFFYVGPAPKRFVARARQEPPQTVAQLAVK
jgi:sortase A